MKASGAILIVAVSFLLSLSSVDAECSTTYDDFSGDTLDTTKWEVYAGGGTSEYGINISEEAFHTLQVTQGNAGTILRMQRLLSLGESVEYDLDYISGSGNNIHHSGINDPDCQGSWEDCHGAWGNLMDPQCPDCYIGFWNSPGRGGTGFGKYKIRMDLGETSMFLSVRKPDGTYWNETFDLSGLNPPYQLDFAAETGHNGLTHMDLDNFVIITSEPCPEPACCSGLRQRISNLEARYTELEERMNSLESAITTIQNSLSLLQSGLDAFKSLILGYFSNVPLLTKQSMICGYMKDNNLKQYSGLGLACEIKGWSTGKPFLEWKNCKCK